MKLIAICLTAIFLFVACGIKGDPTPPTKPFDWQQDVSKKKKAAGEN